MLPAFHGHGLSEKENINLILEKVQQLRDKLGHNEPTPEYHEDHCSLLRKLNRAQGSTRNLPLEVMSMIFRHTLDGVSLFKYTHAALMKLALVSYDWHQIVLSTSQLWKTMEFLDRQVDNNSIGCIIKYLRLYLKNVRGTNLSLSLNFSDSEPLREESITSLLELLSDADNSRKIRSLAMSEPPQILLNCLLTGTLPLLETLDLCTCNDLLAELKDPGYFVRNMPCLSKLHLGHMSPTQVQLSGHVVRCLELEHIPIDMCTALLRECPKLVEAHFVDPVDSRTGAAVPPLESTNMIYLHDLEILSWSYHPDPTCLATFQKIYAPHLEELRFYSGRAFPPNPSLLSELAKFPCLSTLSLLEFYHHELSSLDALRDIFSRTEELLSLGFDDCGYDIIEDALFILDSDSDADMESETEPIDYLPELERFRLSYEARHTEQVGQELQQMLLKLLERQQRHFHLIINASHHTVEWDPDVQLALQSLARRGFVLNTEDRYERVPWLATDNLQPECDDAATVRGSAGGHEVLERVSSCPMDH